MSAKPASCDIVVIGGGVTGLAMAASLHRHGFAVQLIERAQHAPRHDPAGYDPRVYALSPASAGFLQELNVWEAICATRAAPMPRMQVWDRNPATGLNFEASGLGDGVLGWIVEHSLIAQCLWQALPTECLRSGVETRDIVFLDDAVRLELSDGSVLTAALAIGAEGAQSGLRDAAGIDTLGWHYASSAVVCHLRSSAPHQGQALQRFLPSGPVALLPLADGRRSLVWSTTDADAEALLALDDDAFCAHLCEAMQNAAGALSEPTPRLRFALRLMHARDYVAPRCVLIGDSAHLIHPMAGQGLNLGLADAEQLARELTSARAAGRDWSALRTLKRYERARQAHNLEMLAVTDALDRAYRLDLPGWQRLLSLGLGAAERAPLVKQVLAGRAAQS